MTAQEINEAVHLKLGKKPHIVECGESCRCVADIEVPDYCGSIQSAWEIVEFIDKKKYELYVRCHNTLEWECGIRWIEINPFWEHSRIELGDTSPMAICLAFLKLP